MTGVKRKSGGRREGAGRPQGETKTMISVRLDNDLLECLPEEINRNQYINDAVRAKAKKDKLIR